MEKLRKALEKKAASFQMEKQKAEEVVNSFSLYLIRQSMRFKTG